MLKITGSKKNIENCEFVSFITDLLKSDEIQNLKNFKHHIKTTRFQHSLNVSYYNYIVCKKLRWDFVSAARAGILHDLYFYETAEYVGEVRHNKNHPVVALQNAEKFGLNLLEKDIITKHMFPCTLKLPKYKETFVIIVVDKFCAIMEFLAKKSCPKKI
ncbi:hydrolase [Clostridia bacterium]|nr:hydrolase [Clostridia bacterium]